MTLATRPRRRGLAYVADDVIPAALALLPARYDSPRARAALLAIGLHESGLVSRRQVPAGPARGLWQFEPGGGTRGVLMHPNSRANARRVAELRGVEPVTAAVWAAFERDDVLAAVFARLLLWTHPATLPGASEPAALYAIYRDTWRPGKPRPNDWPADFARAWDRVAAA